MSDWVGVLALGAPALHALLMGMIGYPLAIRRPGGLERFHRSGFTWWLIALAVVLALVLTSHPGELAPANPAADVAADSAMLVAMTALVACLCLESCAALLQSARSRMRESTTRDRGAQRYESALPDWARTPGVESSLLILTAVLEEAVYRGAGLTWLTSDLHAPAGLAVGVSAVAFGAAHWYYGVRQIMLKSLLGVVFGIAALTAGWIAAAIAHVALNVVLVVLAARATKTGNEVAS